jgi:hypothetical protein
VNKAVVGVRRAVTLAGLVAGVVVTGTALAGADVLTVVSARLGTATVPPPPVYPTSLQITSGKANGAGKPEKDDVVTITFSAALAPMSVCSTASPTAATQTLTGVTVQLTAGEKTGRDSLTFSAPLTTCANGLDIGEVDVSTTGYVEGSPVSFTNSSVTLTNGGTSTSLTITLGSPGGGAGRLRTVSTAAVARYTPDSAVTDTAGRSITTNRAETPPTVQF